MHWTSGDVTAAVGVPTAVATVWMFWRKAIRPIVKGTGEFFDDWKGVPPRPGVPGRPGVMERLGNIEGQLKPNGGQSMHDAVNRIEQQLSAPQPPPAIHIHPAVEKEQQ